MINRRLWRPLVGASIIVLSLTSCSGSGDGSASNTNPTGSLIIVITDAAVDDVSVVNVRFTGVTLKPENGEQIAITFDAPRDFDLLTLTDGATAQLLEKTEVPAGRYQWVRLAVQAEFDNVFDSYAMTPIGQVELRVPSGSQSGLKLVSGFTVLQNQLTNVVIDWDLRKALTDPVGQPGLHLRPALRITDMAEYGTLAGMVAMDLVTDPNVCTNDPTMNTGSAVYVYTGDVMTPGDIGDATDEPFVTATVTQNMAGEFVYAVHFLPVGDYSAAFTCQASDDDPERDDDIVFTATKAFTIVDGVTEVVDF